MSLEQGYDAKAMRRFFPFFEDKKYKHCAYLDNAATSQKPAVVLERLQRSYVEENANVHRGVYQLSEKATAAYEGVRDQLAKFLGGVSRREVLFTGGTTAGINLVARTWGEANIREGDEILLTVAEHHSNIVPWQIVAEKVGAKIRYIPIREDFRLDMEAAEKLVNKSTKVLAFGHVSNVLGWIHPVQKLIALAKSVGAITVVDGAQAIPHFNVNVRELGCDFYAFSSHKAVGPTGLGVLYGREAVLEKMPPFLGGGDMIATVGDERSTWAELPYKFEAGTPPFAEVMGFGAAIDFLTMMDREGALAHDRELGRKIVRALKGRPGVQLFTDGGDDWVGITSFHHSQVHPHDLAAIQDAHHVCIRAGHHCAQPLMRALKISASSRVSPYLYNTEEDVDLFLKALTKAEELF